MKAHQILEAGIGHMKDRATTYDKPDGERSMGATVVAFNAITGHALTEEQGWLFMALLKMVRSQHGAFRADSYEDGAAYFALAGEAAYAQRLAGIPADLLVGGGAHCLTSKIEPAVLGNVAAFNGDWPNEQRRAEQSEIEANRSRGDTDDLAHCACGDDYPPLSFGAGFIAAYGKCENCAAEEDASAEIAARQDAAAEDEAFARIQSHTGHDGVPIRCPGCTNEACACLA